MTEYTIDSILKREIPALKSDNPRCWGIAKEIYKQAMEHSKREVKLAKEDWDRKAKAAEEERIAKMEKASGELEYRADMTDEELREMFKRQIFKRGATGDFDGSIAGRLIDVFNLKSEKKEIPIEPVQFQDAYPDYATAIALSEKPIPVVE